LIPDLLRRAAGNAVAGDPYYSAVSLLLHFNGANGSTTFTDSSSNNLTVTPTNATISTTQSKFGGASGSFNGTNAFLSPGSASASQFDFGTGDFTVEGWFYFNSFGGANYAPLFANSYLFYVGASGEVLVFNGSSNVVTGTAGDVSLNSWTHIAYSRSGSTLRVFVNGTQKASATVSASIGTSASNYIGRYGSVYLNAYIDEIRVTVGLARYTANFTVPSAPFPDRIGSIEADAYYPQTSLLLHMDGTNASTSFVDSGPNALAVTASGNAQISTTQSKFGVAAGSFDGNGDYVSLPNSSLFTFTGDFTVEGWVYINSLPTSGNYAGLFFSRGNGATDSAFQFYMYNNAGTYRLDQTLSVGSTDYGLTFNFSTAPSANTWNHFAFVRNGSNVYSYWNGVQVGTTQTVSGALNATTYAPTVGGRAGPWPGLWLNGYIDEFRVTKAARYTSNFTPRAKAFPDIYNPYKTLPVSGAALWLDGADSSSLFTDAGVTPVKVNGDLVYQWNDKSGNSRHATQATSGNRPTWVPPASGRNGLGALAFNGTQWLGFTYSFPSSFTIFCVFKNNDTTNGSVIFGRSTGTDHYLFVQSSVRIRLATTQTDDARTNNTNYDYLTIKYADPNITPYASGSSGTTSNVGTQAFLADRIGFYSNSVYNLEGTLAEIIIYPSALSDSDRTSVMNYIKAKWGF